MATSIQSPADLRKERGVSMAMVHTALVVTQLIFGGGSVVGKLGVAKFNPILFAFIREGCAGPILCCIAYAKDRILPKAEHLWWFVVTGFFIYANQLCFIVGIKLSNAVVGSAWQPSQAIMVTAISIAIGWEKATSLKIVGVLLAFGGAAFIVFYGAEIESGSQELAGNILYFLNCLGTALYVIAAKPIFKHYPATSVTAWSYIMGSVMMAITCLVANSVESIYKFVCSDCTGSRWAVPDSAIYALIYWILLTSVSAYLLMTWANQYCDASLVLAYTPLQPATSALLSLILVRLGVKGKLSEPGLNILGVIGIVIGLGFIVHDQRMQQKRDQERYLQINGSDGEKTVADRLGSFIVDDDDEFKSDIREGDL